MRLLQRIEGEMMEASRVWLAGGANTEDPVQAGREALLRIATVFARHGHVVRAIHEASYHDREVERYYRDGVIEDFIQAVAARLRADRRARRTGIRQPEELARALVVMNVNEFFEPLRQSGTDEPAAVARTLADIWVRAIYGELPNV